MIFDRHYHTTAICMASRANVFTGMYEYKTGCNLEHGNMYPEIWEKSYPKLLRSAGYLTAFAGKFGLVVQGKGLCEDDFDFWGGGPGQTNYATAKNKSMKKYAEEFSQSTLSYGAFSRDVIRDSVKQKKPFCLSLSFKALHKPATPDPRFDHVYAGKKFTKPANYGREFGKHMAPQSKTARQYERFESWDYDKDYDNVMATYHQQVHAIDVALGMMRKEVEAQGIVDNTVIIYTSDNGFICGSPGYGSMVLPKKESSRVPLMIFDPRSKTAGKGLRCGKLTGNIDFAPTILEMTGVEAPKNVDGKSLGKMLDDPKAGGHKQLAFINVWGPIARHSLTCVTETQKYTYWWYGDENLNPAEEFYDLKNDSLELKNEADNPQKSAALYQIRKCYDKELDKWKREAVPYNNYQPYGVYFDRTIRIEDKEFPKKKKPKKKAK